MNIKTFLVHIKKRLIITWELWFTNKYFIHFYTKTFAQAGEDLIIHYLFTELGIKKPNYLDIGANYPVAYNNTYYLYHRGSRGVCVEPDPSLIPALETYRRNDVVLNVGVGITNESSADFYVFQVNALNTFSKEEAEYRESFGTYKVQKVIQIPLVNINDLIKTHFTTKLNLLSIDVEGLDLAILESLDYELYRPDVICVETITYDEGKSAKKIQEILDFVRSKQYVIYADTHINTIFVSEHHYPHLK
ncbi:MAG: FkbM family methyltransferase [Chitinophagaceae bacterium]